LDGALHERRRRPADADDEIERAFGEERPEILDERSLRVLVIGNG
jgi:hypothetical protein